MESGLAFFFVLSLLCHHQDNHQNHLQFSKQPYTTMTVTIITTITITVTTTATTTTTSTTSNTTTTSFSMIVEFKSYLVVSCITGKSPLFSYLILYIIKVTRPHFYY